MYIDTSTQSPTTAYFEEARDAVLGDPSTQVAAMLLEHAKDSRQLNRERARAEEAQLRESQQRQVRALREQSDHIRTAGMYKGALMIASGVASAGSAVASSKDSEVWAGALNGAAKGTEGAGELAEAYHDGRAGLLGADATVAEHESGEAERRLADLREANAEVNDLERSALDHFAEVQRARAAADATITAWRG